MDSIPTLRSLYRSLLRTSSKLRDSHLREFFISHARSTFRNHEKSTKHLQNLHLKKTKLMFNPTTSNSTLPKKFETTPSEKTLARTNKFVKNSRGLLKTLEKARLGYPRCVKKVFEIGYARRGRARWEVVNPLLLPLTSAHHPSPTPRLSPSLHRTTPPKVPSLIKTLLLSPNSNKSPVKNAKYLDIPKLAPKPSTPTTHNSPHPNPNPNQGSLNLNLNLNLPPAPTWLPTSLATGPPTLPSHSNPDSEEARLLGMPLSFRRNVRIRWRWINKKLEGMEVPTERRVVVVERGKQSADEDAKEIEGNEIEKGRRRKFVVGGEEAVGILKAVQRANSNRRKIQSQKERKAGTASTERFNVSLKEEEEEPEGESFKPGFLSFPTWQHKGVIVNLEKLVVDSTPFNPAAKLLRPSAKSMTSSSLSPSLSAFPSRAGLKDISSSPSASTSLPPSSPLFSIPTYHALLPSRKVRLPNGEAHLERPNRFTKRFMRRRYMEILKDMPILMTILPEEMDDTNERKDGGKMNSSGLTGQEGNHEKDKENDDKRVDNKVITPVKKKGKNESTSPKRALKKPVETNEPKKKREGKIRHMVSISPFAKGGMAHREVMNEEEAWWNS